MVTHAVPACLAYSLAPLTSPPAAAPLPRCMCAGLYSNHADLSPRYASVLLGITNTTGALPGIVGVATTGGWQCTQGRSAAAPGTLGRIAARQAQPALRSGGRSSAPSPGVPHLPCRLAV